MRKLKIFSVLFFMLLFSNILFGGMVRVNNNLSYSVGAFIDGIYSAHVPGGTHFFKELSTGSHTVFVYNQSNSSTYNIIVNGSTTVIDHNSWQNSNGQGSSNETLRVNNNLSYSVAIEFNGVYRSHLPGGESWFLLIDSGSHVVRIYLYDGSQSKTYNIMVSSSPYIIDHNDWVSTFVNNESMPKAFCLSQNFPNPFNPYTEINFKLPQKEFVLIKVFNTLGNEIKTLTEGTYNAGTHTVYWDGKNQMGTDVSSGTYFYQLKTIQFCKTKKMILSR